MTRHLFVNDPRELMRRVSLSCRGGMGHTTHGFGGGTVQQLLASPAVNFAMGARHTEVAVTAPLVHAYLTQTGPALNAHMLPFSRPNWQVDLGADDGSGEGVPTYLIPYAGGSARGVRLPSQAQDGLAEAWAITAHQDGCTFEVFGPRSSPYVSHSNTIDKAAQERQAKMKDRVDKLHQRFLAAERQADPGFNFPAVPDIRAQFQHYTDDRAAPPDGAIRQVNYSQGVAAVGHLLAPGDHKGGRVETGRVSHTRYHYRLTDQSAHDLAHPGIGAGQVMAKRSHGVWRFFYQLQATLYFHVTEVQKVGPKLTLRRQNLGGAHGLAAEVVLRSGELWPDYSAEDLRFD